MKARLLSLLHRLNGTGRHTAATQKEDTPDPAVRARLLELVRPGYSVDYLISAAHQMRTGRTVGTSR